MCVGESGPAPTTSPSSSRSAARMSGSASTWWKAQASAVAVVSCPATRSVIISSRSSSSLIGAVLVARGDEEGEDVGTLWGGSCPSLGDRGEEQRVDLPPDPEQAAPGTERSEIDLQSRPEPEGIRPEPDPPPEEIPEPAELLPLEAEDRAEDHVERDRLHLGLDGERTSERPALDRAIRDGPHRVPVGEHPLAVERRQHETPLAGMTGAVEEEERVRTEERPQDHGRRPGAEGLLVAGEDPAHRVGRREHDNRDADRQAKREAVPVAVRALLEEARGPKGEAETLMDRMQRGARGEGGGRRHRTPPFDQSDTLKMARAIRLSSARSRSRAGRDV